MSTEADKRRERRHKAKSREWIQFGIEDHDAEIWRAILRSEGFGANSLQTATRDFVEERCREYRRARAEEHYARISSTRTGLIDRETGDGECRLIRASRITSGGGILGPISDDDLMSLEELVEEELLAEDDDPHNPETGECSRVRPKPKMDDL